MRRFFRFLLRATLLVLLATLAFGAFWFGVVPQRLSPFSPLTLDRPDQWFVDPKLAALRRDPDLCQAALKTPHIEASAIPDMPIEKGCGAVNAVRTASVGGARLASERVTCELAAALALWIEYEVQPAALAIYGKRVASVQNMGTYSCRNIVGNAFWKDMRSQHATANAIDIGGFTLEDGRQISVLRNWAGGTEARRKRDQKGKRDETGGGDTDADARFLRDIHARACRYFRVSLGPEFNASHRDHFHYDRGPLWTCK